MWDEIRGHDPRPNREEIQWMAQDIAWLLKRGAVGAAIAVVLSFFY